MATLVEELGKLAAETIDRREQKVEEEKSRLRPHLEKEWKKLRSSAFNAAKTGNTYFAGTINTVACQFTVFKPQPSDVKVALPDELMAVNNDKGPQVSFAGAGGTLRPTFQFRFEFVDSVNKNLATLKRDRAAAEDKDKEEDAAATRVKMEQFFKMGQKGKE